MRTGLTRSRSGRETPRCQRPRRVADGRNPAGQRTGHAGVAKGDQLQNVRVAWAQGKATRGSGGIDGQRRAAFKQGLDAPRGRRHEARRTEADQPRPVRRVAIPPAGNPGETRPRGLPARDDRVCQPAGRHRWEPIAAPVLDDSSVGDRPGRSAQAAVRNVRRESEAGAEGRVDADLQDSCGTSAHGTRMPVGAQRVADGRGRRLIEPMRGAGDRAQGRLLPTPPGAPPGGVVAPVRSQMLRTPFDREMRRRGDPLPRDCRRLGHDL